MTRHEEEYYRNIERIASALEKMLAEKASEIEAGIRKEKAQQKAKEMAIETKAQIEKEELKWSGTGVKSFKDRDAMFEKLALVVVQNQSAENMGSFKGIGHLRTGMVLSQLAVAGIIVSGFKQHGTFEKGDWYVLVKDEKELEELLRRLNNND